MEMRFSDSRSLPPSDSSPGLRPLGWSELCARLVAAHDTRGVLAEVGVGQAGVPDAEPGAAARIPGAGKGSAARRSEHGFSFHESAAALLRSVEAEAERPVNPASSVIGNDEEGTRGSVPNLAPQRRSDENRHD